MTCSPARYTWMLLFLGCYGILSERWLLYSTISEGSTSEESKCTLSPYLLSCAACSASFLSTSSVSCWWRTVKQDGFADLVAEYKGWIRALTLLAFGTTGCLFLQLLLITAEMFPTGIRNTASAHINVCGRVGNVFGPMVFSYVSETGTRLCTNSLSRNWDSPALAT